MLISEPYRALNRELHATGLYGTGAHKWAPVVHELALQCGAATVLDYGCGQGTLRPALTALDPDYRVLEYDPAIAGKEWKPVRADLVACCDVLEHIEPDCLYAVLDDIRNIARAAVFLVVATRPARKTLADGRNAHLIVEPSRWWLPKILDRWRLTMFRELDGKFVCTGASV